MYFRGNQTCRILATAKSQPSVRLLRVKVLAAGGTTGLYSDIRAAFFYLTRKAQFVIGLKRLVSPLVRAEIHPALRATDV